MKQKYVLAAVLTAAFAASSSGAAAQTLRGARLGAGSEKTFRFMPKAKADPKKLLQFSAQQNLMRRDAAPDTELLSPSDAIGMLDAPNGETWYYTGRFERDSVSQGITSYSFVIYDGNFNQVTTISDTTALRDSTETGIVDVQLGSLITNKFFAFEQDYYEFMVGIAANTTSYTNHYYTKVYSADTAKTGAVASFDGYYVDYVNTATDPWNENYYIVFQTEDSTKTPMVNGLKNDNDYVYTVYKKCGYSAPPLPIYEMRVPELCTSGENYIPLISTAHNGTAYFALNYLEYSYFANPDPLAFDLTPTEGNQFIIDLYKVDKNENYNDTLKLDRRTKIPVVASEDNLNFYNLGLFRFEEDLSFNRYTKGDNPAYVVTISHMQGDSYLYSFKVYDAADTVANELLTIGENVGQAVSVSDVRGYDPQVMFIRDSVYEFVNIVSGKVENTLPLDLGNNITMNYNTDRVPDGDSYLYVVSQNRGYEDEENGDTYQNVVFVRRDGTIDHIDSLNVGKDVALAETNNYAEALSPYIFDTDNSREYMTLVKRRVDPESSMTQEFFYIISPDKGVIFTAGPDERLGALSNIILDNSGGAGGKLLLIYNKDFSYTAQSYTLPINSFAGGDGTPASPYKISTAGDLLCMGLKPEADYEIAGDIDLDGVEITPVETFKGTLDGKGFNLMNLNLNGHGLFADVQGPIPEEEGANAIAEASGGVIKDLNIIRPVMTAGDDDAGILADEATMYASISNVRVYDAKVSGSGSGGFGGIVGKADAWTQISGCALVNADINLPDAYDVGGIAGTITSDAKAAACAFSGKIVGGTNVGGIAGELGPTGGVSDCHVNASVRGQNMVGGIVGYIDSRGNSEGDAVNRGTVSRCHVEGSVEATAQYTRAMSPQLGGIVGSLSSDWNHNASADAEAPHVITGCFVNLTELKSVKKPSTARPMWENQFNTIHRIVGNSTENEEPVGKKIFVENGLADNYAIATLGKVQEDVADSTGTTEGKSIEADSLSSGFFAKLGYLFGDTVSSPWNEAAAAAPALFFEGIVVPVFKTAALTVEVEKTGTLTLLLAGITPTEDDIASLTVESSDEGVLSVSSVALSEEGDAVEITVTGVAEGSADVTAAYGGRTVAAKVTVVDLTGIHEAAADKVPLSFDGGTAYAEGCAIEVYSAEGAKVASGRGSCDLSRLAHGVYIVVAKDGSRRSALKVSI